MGILRLPTPEQALRGRTQAMPVPPRHEVTGAPLVPPFPDRFETAQFAMGCFWGAERKFWQTPGVYTTAVGYAGGLTPNPTYHEVCSGLTGHAEAVLVVFDPNVVRYEDLLKIFWESHDPTQGMRQGNDVGTQYRSMIMYCPEPAQRAREGAARGVGDPASDHAGVRGGAPNEKAAQRQAAEASRDAYQQALTAAGHGRITTEIAPASAFYYAEPDHQQYLAKNPWGYCGIGGTGVGCPTGVVSA